MYRLWQIKKVSDSFFWKPIKSRVSLPRALKPSLTGGQNWERFSLHKTFALALVSYHYAEKKLIPFCIAIRKKIKIKKTRFNWTRCFHICVEGFAAVKPLFVNLEFAYSRKVTKEGNPKRILETWQYKNGEAFIAIYSHELMKKFFT